MKQYPKVFSKEGQEKLGTLVAKQRTLLAGLDIYIKETEHNYILSQVEFLKFPTVILNYVIGTILSIFPIPDVKEIGNELKSNEYAKKNVTTGSRITDHYSKSKYNRETAIQHYIERQNKIYKKVNLKLIK